jgi:GNAT superfamily N-acetyltransferase
MHQSVTAADLATMEGFFRERGASVQHEVSPLADESAFAQLNARGYHPIEFTSVMYRPIEPGIRLTSVPNERVHVRRTRAEDAEVYVKISTEGWSEFAEFADLMTELSRVAVARVGGMLFLAEVNGQAIASGALSISDGVALMAGASTIAAARNQGAQLALLEHRLRYAADAGCDLAMMCARPGSASQRNAERHGFRIAYTRIKWNLMSAI